MLRLALAVTSLDDPAPLERLLSNGRYGVLVTAAGAGRSTWNGLLLTADGIFVYLRDLERGTLWSVGRQPVGRRADRCEVADDAGRMTITRLDDGIEATLDVAVDPDRDREIRHLHLRNESSSRRRIEVTSYAEVVLADPGAHAAHPAFSKLFVQTELDAETLLAHRRPRTASERIPWMAHALHGPGPLEHETDRVRFLGRGRSVERPLAATRALSGTTGSVLDPVFALRRTVDLPPGGEAALMLVVAAADTRATALALARAPAGLASGPEVAARPPSGPDAVRPPEAPAETIFWNGHGGFTRDGSEYVIRIDGSSRPPMPWVNVIANESFGFLVSEAGAGYTWSRNSRENRLTPWSNDPVVDPHGEALYVRDEDAGVFWSPMPGPVPSAARCEVRHGFGYSRWTQLSHELEQDVCTFVPRGDPVKVVRLTITNRSGQTRRLALVWYARLVLGVLPSATVVTGFDADAQAVVARNPSNGDFADGTVFAAAVAPGPIRFTTDRTAFLGRHGTTSHPAALSGAPLDGATGAGLDPCAALEVGVTIAPGATLACAFLLGETTEPGAVRTIVDRYREPGAIARALDEVCGFWRGILSAIHIETPSPAIDVMVNGWLTYQNLACRLWGRSAFYQSGGAFGFRDQLQDAAALVHVRPDLTRAQILLHAAHQFVEGDVLHWWHPPADRGTRTRFSDDLLWLPYVTAFYVRTTGDETVLAEPAPFLTARALMPGEDETYLLPSRAEESADVYAHCCRALDRSLTCGAHGLPLMGTGDWNDGMNRVGREGRGESVWLGFFLYRVLGDFIPLCEGRGDAIRAQRYAAYRAELQHALEQSGWDGGWYRRAYYDDGTPLGSATNDECRIDALAQAWAVISGAASPDRAARAMDAVERELVDEAAGLVRLLAPPFDRTAHDPGYIKGYVPGIRENGGQYTHAALWVVRALAELGRRDRAVRLLEMLTPVAHAGSPETVDVYKVEPYVVAADVYGVAPHVGRGGWTWYTGSAGWMYRVALESVLGVTLEGGDTIRVQPRIPDGWPEYSVQLRLADGRTRYDVRVVNPDGNAQEVVACEAGVVERGSARIAVVADGGVHRVIVTLGGRGPRGVEAEELGWHA